MELSCLRQTLENKEECQRSPKIAKGRQLATLEITLQIMGFAAKSAEDRQRNLAALDREGGEEVGVKHV